MKYFWLSLFVAIFAFFAYMHDKQNENPSDSPTDMVETSELDSFTKAEVSRAIRHAHEEYGTPDKVSYQIKCVDSAREAVDIVKGINYFTGVSISKNGDTLFICPMAFKITRDPDKTLYNVILDELLKNRK